MKQWVFINVFLFSWNDQQWIVVDGTGGTATAAISATTWQFACNWENLSIAHSPCRWIPNVQVVVPCKKIQSTMGVPLNKPAQRTESWKCSYEAVLYLYIYIYWKSKFQGFQTSEYSWYRFNCFTCLDWWTSYSWILSWSMNWQVYELYQLFSLCFFVHINIANTNVKSSCTYLYLAVTNQILRGNCAVSFYL